MQDIEVKDNLLLPATLHTADCTDNSSPRESRPRPQVEHPSTLSGLMRTRRSFPVSNHESPTMCLYSTIVNDMLRYINLVGWYNAIVMSFWKGLSCIGLLRINNLNNYMFLVDVVPKGQTQQPGV